MPGVDSNCAAATQLGTDQSAAGSDATSARLWSAEWVHRERSWRVGHTGMRMQACVDGDCQKPFLVAADMQDDDDDGNHDNRGGVVVVANGLDPGSAHTVVVWKLNEDTAGNDGNPKRGTAIFHGFHLDAGAQVHAPAPRKPHKIWFIGDSDTAGWCADGKAKPDTYWTAHKYENAHETWAAQLAAAVNAEMMVTAISGYGIGAGAPAIQNNLPNSVNFDGDSTPYDYVRGSMHAMHVRPLSRIG